MRMLFGALPEGFAVALAVVLHRVPGAPSALRRILQRGCRLVVEDAVEDSRIARGHVLVAPADRHLVLLTGGGVRFRSGEHQFLMSAVDPVLESAAEVYGERSIGVILSGGGADGTAGARAVREAGGVMVVQDDATHGDMPGSVRDAGCADLVLAQDRIGPALITLVQQGREAGLAEA